MVKHGLWQPGPGAARRGPGGSRTALRPVADTSSGQNHQAAAGQDLSQPRFFRAPGGSTGCHLAGCLAHVLSSAAGPSRPPRFRRAARGAQGRFHTVVGLRPGRRTWPDWPLTCSTLLRGTGQAPEVVGLSGAVPARPPVGTGQSDRVVDAVPVRAGAQGAGAWKRPPHDPVPHRGLQVGLV
jgi:hypothetical protein